MKRRARLCIILLVLSVLSLMGMSLRCLWCFTEILSVPARDIADPFLREAMEEAPLLTGLTALVAPGAILGTLFWNIINLIADRLRYQRKRKWKK